MTVLEVYSSYVIFVSHLLNIITAYTFIVSKLKSNHHNNVLTEPGTVFLLQHVHVNLFLPEFSELFMYLFILSFLF